jgi:phage gp29-like protein
LTAIEQYGQGPGNKPVVLPVDRLVVYCHEREGAAWQGTSLLRPAYKHWILKDRLIRTQAQTIERNGMGVPVYEGAEGETDLTNGFNIAKGYRAGESAGAAIPNGAKLRLLGVEGQTPNADPAVRYHDEQIARAVLAHFLNLGTQTGSWALGTTFADFFTLSLQTVAQQVADVGSQHIVEDLVDVNWGEDEPAPRIGFEEIGARQAATAQAVKLLTDAGILLPDRSLEEAIREQHNLPPKDPRPNLPAPPTAVTEPTPPPGSEDAPTN